MADEVARRIVMPRATWDAIVAAADAAKVQPADHAAKLLDVGLRVAQDAAEAEAPIIPIDTHQRPHDAEVLRVMEAIGAPTTNAKIREKMHGSKEEADIRDPAGENTTESLMRLKAAGLVFLDGRPRRWQRTARRWSIQPW